MADGGNGKGPGMSERGGMASFLGREADRPRVRPTGLTYGPDDRPPPVVTLGLALQHLSVQSIYFVLAIATASSFTSDPAEITRFLALSILGAAAWQMLQLLPRGPVGSGYPVPGTHTPSLIGPAQVIAATGGNLATVAALGIVAGAACLPLTFLMRRVRVLLPNEVAGVVVLLIGVALLILGVQRLGLQPGGTPAPAEAGLVLLGSLLAMMLVALSRTRAAPFAVLIGAVLGVVLALALGLTMPGGAELVASQPWLALPRPIVPDFGGVTPAGIFVFLVALVAVKGTLLGNLLLYQRAADASWTRPDAPPLRRGMLANGLGMMLSSAIGGAGPGPATAALGISVATGTLARRIVWVGTALLAAVAFCPKLVSLFVLVPDPVKAAMVMYFGGFVAVQGGQLMTSRLLDTRRMMVAAFGLMAGLVVAIAPAPFLAAVPAIASPLSAGALVAFLVNLATLPFVRRTATATLQVDGTVARTAAEWCAAIGGAWGLKPQTASAAEHALLELAELLAGRGQDAIQLTARSAEDRVIFTMSWAGPALPAPTARPAAEDLLGPAAAQEGFAVWLATRRAQEFTQRPAPGGGTEALLVFED